MYRVALTGLLLLSVAQAAHSPDTLRASAQRAIAQLQKSIAIWDKQRDCASCHHQAFPMLAFAVARERGVRVDEAALQRSIDKNLSYLANFDRALQATHVIDIAMSDALTLLSAAELGLPRSVSTDAYIRLLASRQFPDGHWTAFDERPPQSASRITSTAWAVRALTRLAPPRMAASLKPRLASAAAWLRAEKPLSTEDVADRLRGLHWAGFTARQDAHQLKTLQRADGGWGQLPSRPSDAYATASALTALVEAGAVSTNEPLYQRGLQYLLNTQEDSGIWHVRTRLHPPVPLSPEYVDAGLPHGHDQFISAMATCRAVVALLLPLPKAAAAPARLDFAKTLPPDPEPWLDAAMFGRADELKSLLDRGLDPNAATPRGTTLLMAAAPDPAKVRLLLARGAKVNARAESRYDALMIAANHRAPESARLLVDAGAEVNPPRNPAPRFNASAFFFAVYANDLDTARMLLARGANPATGMLVGGGVAGEIRPIDIASAQYDTPMLKLLLTAGINVNSASGPVKLTALNWAVFANDLSMLRMLIKAGADVNHQDGLGWTPLHWAANIDYGDSEILNELLKAGARRQARNNDGDTPLAVAKKYSHASHTAILER